MRPQDRHAEAFGREVLGPVFGEFALRLHLFLMGIEPTEDARLLFCARGGLRLRRIYEAFLSAAGLNCPMPYGDLMVSRLVAARTALAEGSPEAYEELEREFRGDTLERVARALVQRELMPGEDADAPFTPDALARLLTEPTARGGMFRAELEAQNRLFGQHLSEVAGSARRLILCDTGLYGSTVRLLRAGRPDRDWLCALFARSNYKGFSETHFPVTIGLSVESAGYRATEPRTSVLRYWHLIESSLEPDLPSVVSFRKVGGQARANLIQPGWEQQLEGQPGERFTGVMAYLEALPGRRAAEQIYADAPRAWKRLHDAIVWPSRSDRQILAGAERSRDFGREESVAVVTTSQTPRGLQDVQASLWREGAVIDQFPTTRWIWLSALQAAHLARGVLASGKRTAEASAPPGGALSS
jgi:hypothetical protein